MRLHARTLRSAAAAVADAAAAAPRRRRHRRGRLLHAWGNADCGQLGVALRPGDEELDTVGRAVHAPRRVPVPPASEGASASDTRRRTSARAAAAGARAAGAASAQPGAASEAAVADVSCGAAHTVVALVGGELLTCGLDDRGQLGAANPRADRARGRLTPVPGLPPVRAVAAGGSHTLAVTEDGRLFSFGCNARGQLGRPETTPTAAGTKADPAPGLVVGLADAGEQVVSAAAGADFSVALGESGRVYTWGAGDVGKLGHGEPVNGRGGGWIMAVASALLPRGRNYAGDECRPRLVKALEGEPAAAVFAGAHCAGALLRSGRFVVWGNGRGYMLGNGRDADVWEPEPALQALSPGAGSKIAFGLTHALFLTGRGDVYAVGAGDHGCLGISSQDTAFEPVPVSLPSGAGVVDVAAGWCVSLAAQRDGPVLAWGCGSAGALGRGLDIIDCWIPEEVRLLESDEMGLWPQNVAAPSTGRHALAW